jgi:hypothetical protein
MNTLCGTKASPLPPQKPECGSDDLNNRSDPFFGFFHSINPTSFLSAEPGN